MHSSTLVVLQKLLDDGEFIVKLKQRRQVRKNRAFLGFVSDFGKEGILLGVIEFIFAGFAAHMTLDQMEDLVINVTKEMWDINAKEVQLIDYVFPFTSLSESELESIINYQITKQFPKLDKFRVHSNSAC